MDEHLQGREWFICQCVVEYAVNLDRSYLGGGGQKNTAHFVDSAGVVCHGSMIGQGTCMRATSAAMPP